MVHRSWTSDSTKAAHNSHLWKIKPIATASARAERRRLRSRPGDQNCSARPNGNREAAEAPEKAFRTYSQFAPVRRGQQCVRALDGDSARFLVLEDDCAFVRVPRAGEQPAAQVVADGVLELQRGAQVLRFQLPPHYDRIRLTAHTTPEHHEVRIPLPDAPADDVLLLAFQ